MYTIFLLTINIKLIRLTNKKGYSFFNYLKFVTKCVRKKSTRIYCSISLIRAIRKVERNGYKFTRLKFIFVFLHKILIDSLAIVKKHRSKRYCENEWRRIRYWKPQVEFFALFLLHQTFSLFWVECILLEEQSDFESKVYLHSFRNLGFIKILRF